MLELPKTLLLQLLGDLGLDLFELGQLGFSHIVQSNDVEAELALDRGLGVLAFVQGHHGVREFFDEVAGSGPIQIATIGTGSGILGLLLGQVFKLDRKSTRLNSSH